MCVSETLESGVFLTCFLRCDSKEDGQLLQVYFWKTHPPLTETSLLPFNPYLVKPYWKSGLFFFFFFPLEVNLLILSINLLCLFNYSFLWSFESVKRCLRPVSFNLTVETKCFSWEVGPRSCHILCCLEIRRVYLCIQTVFVSCGCCNRDHKLGGFNNRKLLSPSPGGQKALIRVCAGARILRGSRGRDFASVSLW